MTDETNSENEWRRIIKDERKINEALLDHQGCVYDNCYLRIFGVITVPFDVTQFDGTHSICYVNTPLCEKHYKQTPAVEYKWSKEDKDEDVT